MMELGNMLFGNSRGEYEVPRTAAFEEPWERFTEALKIHYRGWADEGCLVPELTDWNGVGNAVFQIRAYDWDAECDCGAEAAMEEWHEGHAHAPDCYQTELRTRMKSWEERSGYAAADAALHEDSDGPFAGMETEIEEPEPGVTFMTFTPRRDEAMALWRKLYDRKRRVEDKLYKELCAKHEKPAQGCACHCTCTHDDDAEAYWNLIGGHTASCRLIQPNFLFKPTGFRLNWYKYPFRDAYMSEPLKPKQWRDMLDVCAASVLSDGAPTRQDETPDAVPRAPASEGMNKNKPLSAAPVPDSQENP